MAKILDRLADTNGNITFSQSVIAPGTTYVLDNTFDVSTAYELSLQLTATLSQASNGTDSFQVNLYNSIDGTNFGLSQPLVSVVYTPDDTNTDITFTSQNVGISSLRYLKMGIVNNLGVTLSQSIIGDKALF